MKKSVPDMTEGRMKMAWEWAVEPDMAGLDLGDLILLVVGGSNIHSTLKEASLVEVLVLVAFISNAGFAALFLAPLTKLECRSA